MIVEPSVYKLLSVRVKDIYPHPRASNLQLYVIEAFGKERVCVQEKDYLQEGEMCALFLEGSNLPARGWTLPYRKYLVNDKVKIISIRSVRSYGILEKLSLTIEHSYIDALGPGCYLNKWLKEND